MLNRNQIAHEYAVNLIKKANYSFELRNLPNESFNLADAMIAEAEKRKNMERPSVLGDGWISVEDRLPENDTDVLTCDAKEELWIDVHPFSRRTTHWQPLPSPPKP